MFSNSNNNSTPLAPAPLGIIVAMTSELNMLLEEMDTAESCTVHGYTFHTGKIGDVPVVAMQCGIGKVNAAAGAITMIDAFAPRAIINTGIAGGTGQGASVLDLVIGSEVAYHDVWCGPGQAPGRVQGLPERFAGAMDIVPADAIPAHARIGLIASGDRFITTAADLAAVLAVQPRAMAVDMESGAIAQVCHLRRVPFLAIRVVSDTPGSENHTDQYLNFWNEAPARTFSALQTIIGAIR